MIAHLKTLSSPFDPYPSRSAEALGIPFPRASPFPAIPSDLLHCARTTLSQKSPHMFVGFQHCSTVWPRFIPQSREGAAPRSPSTGLALWQRHRVNSEKTYSRHPCTPFSSCYLANGFLSIWLRYNTDPDEVLSIGISTKPRALEWHRLQKQRKSEAVCFLA